jgi:hypothetical protein
MSLGMWRAGGLCICAMVWGCNATCLRNSDCQGDSTCIKGRCVLFVRDAGSRPPSLEPDPSQGGSAGAAGGAGVGGAAGTAGSGGTATGPREILDAASDAAL